MIKKAWEKDKRKVKKLVEGKSFDYFCSCICMGFLFIQKEQR